MMMYFIYKNYKIDNGMGALQFGQISWIMLKV